MSFLVHKYQSKGTGYPSHIPLIQTPESFSTYIDNSWINNKFNDCKILTLRGYQSTQHLCLTYLCLGWVLGVLVTWDMGRVPSVSDDDDVVSVDDMTGGRW